MKKKGFSITIGCLFLLGAVSWLMGAYPTTTSTTSLPKSKESDMQLAYKTETAAAKIPPIDSAAPSVYETASFGLG